MARRDYTAIGAMRSKGMQCRPTLALLLVLVAFGTSGCADHLCGPTKPDSTNSSCSIRGPMQPTYFPAVAG
jgi:hypothetical protein